MQHHADGLETLRLLLLFPASGGEEGSWLPLSGNPVALDYADPDNERSARPEDSDAIYPPSSWAKYGFPVLLPSHWGTTVLHVLLLAWHRSEVLLEGSLSI
eukprot:9529530-Alexandrium_andersonii.AAC.1